jgi:hypothetical protein
VTRVETAQAPRRIVSGDRARMLSNAVVCSRVRGLQEALSAGTIALEISSRNARVQALQERWDYLRAASI